MILPDLVYQEASPEEAANPFDSDSVSIEITHSVDVPSLVEALRRRTGDPDIQAIIGFPPGEDEPSEEKPGTLYVSDGSVDTKVLEQLAESHKVEATALPQEAFFTPAPNPDVVAQPTVAVSVSPERTDVTAPLMDKLRSGQDLNIDELNDVLRGMLNYRHVKRDASSDESEAPKEAPKRRTRKTAAKKATESKD